MEPDYIGDGVEYTRVSKVAMSIGKSTDAVVETVKRLKLNHLIVNIGSKRTTVLPFESIVEVKAYYIAKAKKRVQPRPKDIRNEACVAECEGCSNKMNNNKCRISIDPGYHWHEGMWKEGMCCFRKLWEER